MINAQTPLGPYPGTVGAGALAITMTAADTTNNNAFALSGKEVLIVENSGASPYTLTIHSTPDASGRTGDITTYSIAANSVAAFNFRGGVQGWQQSDGNCYIDGSNAALLFAVLRFTS
jgi:hypothetical protein